MATTTRKKAPKSKVKRPKLVKAKQAIAPSSRAKKPPARARIARDEAPQTVTVDFEVKRTNVTSAEIDVDGNDVTLQNGRGSATVDAGTHRLGWHFEGNAGAKLEIEGKVGNKPVVKAADEIPTGEHKAWGKKNFEASNE